MLRLIHYLLHGCWHEWGEHYTRPISHYDCSFGYRSFMYDDALFRCRKCGRAKRFKI